MREFCLKIYNQHLNMSKFLPFRQIKTNKLKARNTDTHNSECINENKQRELRTFTVVRGMYVNLDTVCILSFR